MALARLEACARRQAAGCKAAQQLVTVKLRRLRASATQFEAMPQSALSMASALKDRLGGSVGSQLEKHGSVGASAHSLRAFSQQQDETETQRPHARRAMVTRMTLLTTGQLLLHCADHTAKLESADSLFLTG